jgi:hypothetical protein
MKTGKQAVKGATIVKSISAKKRRPGSASPEKKKPSKKLRGER